jgi:glycosyltransferase involved in cell wall biosynthesis
MKTIAVIATTGNRKEELKRAVSSLVDQVDELLIYDNSKNPDLTDNAKFYYLQFQKDPVYYITADDKIIYPPNYVETLKKAIDKHQCVCTFHGRLLVDGPKYYNGRHIVFHYLQDVPSSVRVDVPGTGVMGFRTDHFNPENLYKSEYKRMSDLTFALEAKRAGVKIICLKHERNWLKSLYLRDSISVKMSKPGADQSKYVELMKRILNEK